MPLVLGSEPTRGTTGESDLGKKELGGLASPTKEPQAIASELESHLSEFGEEVRWDSWLHTRIQHYSRSLLCSRWKGSN